MVPQVASLIGQIKKFEVFHKVDHAYWPEFSHHYNCLLNRDWRVSAQLLLTKTVSETIQNLNTSFKILHLLNSHRQQCSVLLDTAFNMFALSLIFTSHFPVLTASLH